MYLEISGYWFIVPVTFYQPDDRRDPCPQKSTHKENPSMSYCPIELQNAKGISESSNESREKEEKDRTSLLKLLQEIIRPPFVGWMGSYSKFRSGPQSVEQSDQESSNSSS